MSNQLGFGQPVPNKKAGKSTVQRRKAAQQYDKMKADGLPEFNIFIRIRDRKNWFPVGSLAVSRTNKINEAIFENEEALLQGGIRLFPILRKHQGQLEYGYRLKEFNDEPIQVAVKPEPKALNGFQRAIAQVQDRIKGLAKR